MKRKISIFILILALAICTVPQQDALALTPPKEPMYRYEVPRDFIWWLYDKKESEQESEYAQEFIKAYKDEQGYLLVPKITDAVLDDVCWGYEGISVNYGFHKGDISWVMYVRPAKDCKEQYAYTFDYYSNDIVELVNKKEGGIELNKNKSYEWIYEEDPQRSCIITEYYLKKRLRLGDHTTVDCVQKNWHKKYLYNNQGYVHVTLHFIKDGMYIWLTSHLHEGQENATFDTLKTCTFEKMPTNPKLSLDKKKNKISKKNAILHTTLQNPTNQNFTHVELWLYDKKEKRYRKFLRRKVTKKSMRKEKVALKFNVQKIVKDWRKQSARRNQSSFPLKRKKKYKYMVRTKVLGKYLAVKGSFQLK